MEDGSKPATLLQLMRTDFEKLIEEYAGLKKRFAFIGQMRVRNQAKKVFYISVRVPEGGWGEGVGVEWDGSGCKVWVGCVCVSFLTE